MKKNKFNRKALHFVMLFLLIGFATADGFCQDSARLATNEYAARSGRQIAFVAEKNTFSTNDKSFASNNRQTTYARPDKAERLKKYVRRTFGAYAFAGYALSAGVSQLTDTPEEWENNFKGYARRFGSAFGKSAIKNTTIYGLDEALKLDSNFYRSGSKKFGDRFKNAVLSTFTARTSSGKRVFGAPRIIGIYASNVIAAEAWYPPRYDYKDGLRTGTFSLGVDVAFNLLREFIRK
jgi:hypothetical protein